MSRCGKTREREREGERERETERESQRETETDTVYIYNLPHPHRICVFPILQLNSNANLLTICPHFVFMFFPPFGLRSGRISSKEREVPLSNRIQESKIVG